MRRLFKVLIIIVIVLAIVAGALTYLYHDKNSPLKSTLNATVLVCCVDPSEGRPGPGACDMAFAVYLDDGNVTNVTPIYPGGMVDPYQPPLEIETENGVNYLMLHDTLWWNNTSYDADRAKETVLYNTGINASVVVMVKPAAIDAILQSIGGVNVNGTLVTNDSIDFMRNEQKYGNMSRGNAIETIAFAIKNSYKNESNREKIRNTIIDQYHQGNIIVEPEDFMNKFLAEDSLNKIFG